MTPNKNVPPKHNLDDIPPIVFIVLTLTILMVGASGAHASSPTAASGVVQDAPELALIPPVSQAPIILSGTCDGAVAVFSVRNNAARWAGRGEVSLIDAATGRVLRTRQMLFGERQTASFRVPARETQSGRYRLAVRTVDGRMTYAKSFVGHCRPRERDARTAQR